MWHVARGGGDHGHFLHSRVRPEELRAPDPGAGRLGSAVALWIDSDLCPLIQDGGDSAVGFACGRKFLLSRQ